MPPTSTRLATYRRTIVILELEIIDNTLQEAKSEDLAGLESFFTRIDAISASDKEFPSLFF